LEKAEAYLMTKGKLLFLLAFAAGTMSAGPIVWNFNSILFGDGTTVTGSFTFNADTTAFSALNMTTSGGTSLPATSSWVFDTNNLPAAEQNASSVTGFEAVDALSGNETGAHVISLYSTLGPLMTNAGGTITLNFLRAGTCADAVCANLNLALNNSVSGSGQFTSVATPEPSTWFTGLLAFAVVFVAMRRRISASHS
jgi:hypothetical protein